MKFPERADPGAIATVSQNGARDGGCDAPDAPIDHVRRTIMGRAAALATLAAAPGMGLPGRAFAQAANNKPGDSVKALIFDVFGTVVDWRNGVARGSKAILEPRGYTLDWIPFAEAWRGEYQPAMEEVRSGKIPFSKLDVIHRRMLERIRGRFGLEKLDEPVLQELTLVWHKLDAWKDVGTGFARLRRRFLMAPCSNGNIALQVDLARHNDIRWDAILGAEIAGDYKPKPRVYLASAEALNLEPQQVVMVAAHSDDLKAAAAVGLRTAHVARPEEFTGNTGETGPKYPVDFAAKSFDALADLMGA